METSREGSVKSISAVTFIVASMEDSVKFYEALGFKKLYVGSGEAFTSFRVGDGYLNIASGVKEESRLWGRVIFYVEDVDEMYRRVLSVGLQPSTEPTDAVWGERYFHLRDPDGNELSFARPLTTN